MSSLSPHKLHVEYLQGITPEGPITKRAYTLTHSDRTGELYLTIGTMYYWPQISGWYTRFMRDEVLAMWHFEVVPSLHVHCHVSGGIIFGFPGWRKSIFVHHMPMVLESFRFGDRKLFEAHQELDNARVWIHFHRARSHRDTLEDWGLLKDYQI